VQIRESSQGFVVVLEPGEELLSCLTAFARPALLLHRT
jgi:hypothetical protein